MKLTSAVIAFLALLALAPVAVSAQVTTFVAPSRAKVDSGKQVVAAARKASSDSTARMTLTNMKAWVDSAAGVAVATTTAADTTAPVTSTTQQTTTTRRSTTTFSSGAIAPNTASPLPLLLVVGALLGSLGVLLLVSGRERRPAPIGARKRS